MLSFFFFFSLTKLKLFLKFEQHSQDNVASCGAILDVKSNCFFIQHIQTLQSVAQW